MDICRVCCVLSGRGLCDELTTRPEEYYGLWCVVCGLENTFLVNEEECQGPLGGNGAKGKKMLGYIKTGANNKREFCSTFYKEFQYS